MSIDLQYCRALLGQPGFGPEQEFGMEGHWLVDEKAPEAHAFIREFYIEHDGRMPTPDTVEAKIGIKLPVAPEPYLYYLIEVTTRRQRNVAHSGITDAIHALEAGDVEAVKDSLNKAIRRINAIAQYKEPNLIDVRQTTEDRWREYERVEALGGAIDGFASPWPHLDEHTRGIHLGEFWVIMARTKMGKTFAEIMFANHFWKAGVTPLLVTEEMSINAMCRRMDALMSAVPYRGFKSSTLDATNKQRYRATLDTMKSMKPFWIANAARARKPSEIELLIREIKPQVVCIDGIYLMKSDGRATSKYDHVSAVADDLQRIAQTTGVPIMVTTQLNRKQGAEHGEVDSGNVGYAFEQIQNAHVVLGLARTEEDRIMNRMRLSLLEHREGDSLNMAIEWDLDQMRFGEIGMMDGGNLVPFPAPAGQSAQTGQPAIPAAPKPAPMTLGKSIAW